MQPQLQSLRIDTAELKAQIVKIIGAEKSKRYFFYLNRFLNQKLSKSEFDKFCSRVIGRDNLPLHNRFILSILKNACGSKTPPPSLNEAGPTKLAIHDGHEQSESRGGTCAPDAIIKSNGTLLQTSPKKIRSRKLRDQPSPIGSSQRTDTPLLHSKFTEDGDRKVVIKNGDFTPFDYPIPTQKLQGRAEQPENQREAFISRSLGRPNQVSFYLNGQVDMPVLANEEHKEQAYQSNVPGTPLIAPLGIPLCSASIGGGCKALPMPSRSNYVSYCDCGGLYGMEMLKHRMEQIAATQGLGGVSLESAAMVNGMVDVYLKRLIKSSVELVRAKSGPDPINQHFLNIVDNQHKLVNGMWPSNHSYMQSSSGPMLVSQEQKSSSISLLDFKVAMELNPRQLGEDWPLVLEKIGMHAFAD